MTKILNVEDELYDVDAILAFLESAFNDDCQGLDLNLSTESSGIDPARPIGVVRRTLARLIQDLADVEHDIRGELDVHEADEAAK